MPRCGKDQADPMLLHTAYRLLHTAYCDTPVAQLAEQPSPKRQVAGSIPSRRVLRRSQAAPAGRDRDL